MIQVKRKEGWEGFCVFHLLGESLLRAGEGQEGVLSGGGGGHGQGPGPVVSARWLQPQLRVWVLFWGGTTLPASRHSAIVQNGIGPRKLGACENRYEFCKTALRQ